MKLIYTRDACWLMPHAKKFLLVMKITTLLLIASIMQVSATGFAQRLSFSQKQVSFKNLFREIKKQTGYSIFYSNQKLDEDKKLDVNFKNTPLEEVLETSLKNLPLTFTIEDKAIFIKDRETSFLDNIIARFQEVDIKGKVVDSLGNGIGGATVTVKGTKQGTSTAANGDFSMRNVDESVTLVISYLGYVTKESSVNKEFNYIQLQQSTSKLDEVQVIAYGKTSQRLNTGNITVVKSEDIARQPVNNPLYALQGRVPGLQVTPTTGLAGGAVNLQIRGKSSLNSGTEPLLVVDGLPVTNNITSLGHPGYNGQLSSISFINPNNIESISVLKDADATSIYGSRGANGVILITTKKGIVGDTRITFDLKTGASDVPRRIKLFNTKEYLQFRRDILKNDGINTNEFPWNLEDLAPLVGDLTFWDQNRYTDWQKVLIGKKAPLQNVQGSMSGGTPSLNYLLSGNYSKEGTVFDQTNADQRGGTSLTISGISNNQKLRTTLRTQYLYNRNTLPGIDFTEKALTLAPNAPDLYNEDGKLNWEPLPSGQKSWNNPYQETLKIYKGSIRNITANGDISYQIINGLDAIVQLGFNDLRGNSIRSTSLIGALSPNEINLSSRAGASFHSTTSQSFSIEPQVKYNKFFGKNIINVLVGSSYQTNSTTAQLISADGAISDDLIENLEAFSQTRVSNQSSQYKYVAGFARLSYSFANKYLANFTIRRDGSSRFGPGNQFGTFGSGSAAWILSEEGFFKNIKPQISFVKLRTSYGTSGNDRIGDYAFLEKYSAQTTFVQVPYQGSIGFRTSGLYNLNYAWEVVKKSELGIDLGFLNDRILLRSSYFRNRSSNQLAAYPMPSMAGPGALTVNIPATIQNSGLEAVLETEIIKKQNFSWSTNFIFSKLYNKLLAYDEIEISPYYQSIIGQQFYGIRRRYQFNSVDPDKGMPLFTTINGEITSNPVKQNSNDNGAYVRTNSNPSFDGGFGSSLRFKGITIDFFLQVRRQIGENPIISYLDYLVQGNNLPIEFKDMWRNPGDISNIPKLYSLIYPDEYNQQLNSFRSSTFLNVDASFIRLKNFSVGYDLPTRLISKLHLKAIQFNMQGQNLITITKYKGLDPETGSVFSLPPLRTLIFGMKVSL